MLSFLRRKSRGALRRILSLFRGKSRAALPPAAASASASLGRSFCQNGYVRIPQVLKRSEVSEFRDAALRLLPPSAPPYKAQSSNTALFHDPFRRLFRNELLTGTLRALLGSDFVFVNELALHDSIYAGWHTDTTSPEAKAGHEFHWSPTYLMVQVAIYLQDNGSNGGGLAVVPRSHHTDDPVAITMRGGEVANPFKGTVAIDSEAGDLIVFHLRLSHRATEAKRPARSDAERKLALFMVAGANNASTRRYREWLDQYDGMNGTARPAIPGDFQTFLSDVGLQVI